MDKSEILKKIQHGLIVSCQALSTEPLYSSFIMGRMAFAAYQGGAVAIRANTPSDIKEIKKAVDLPVIGLYKVEYDDSQVYITPTMKEIDELMEVGPEIIAMDATNRLRPNKQTLAEFFKEVKAKYPNQMFMADTSCYEEGVTAKELGFDIIGTTMSGYTEYTKGTKLPNYDLMKRYVDTLGMPIIAEGGIWTPEQLKAALDLGVWCAVVGTAITRPQNITERFVKGI
ncbi:MAG: nanE [Caproiciproducens sp.]|nr:nanE [Caproiciproducens sp.]